ncbi:MAG: aldose 1-epimerase family protein [Treponema sp.]|nr:aldose 1-epimerase family protein [Treponema sp.]
MENLLGPYPDYRKALSGMEAAAGIIRYRLDEGPGNGMRIAEVYTAAGLRYSVLLDRGMDIGAASFRGIPAAFVGKGGIMGTANASAAQNFYRYFTAGLVYTCGLENLGEPCESSGKILPMHGSRTFLSAFDVSSSMEYEKGLPVLRVRGKMRSASLFGENILLVREIISGAESGSIEIIDTIENQGSSVYEYMLMYHINFGFPLVSPDSSICTNHRTVYYLETTKTPKEEEYRSFIEPQKTFSELTFEMHNPEGKEAYAFLQNPRMGLEARVSYKVDELPCFTQWVNMAEQDYVLGLEPGTHYPIGRTKAAAAGGLFPLEPEEQKSYSIVISISAGT